MNDVDNRVVQMEFDNAQFQKGVAETIKSLESLEKALELQGASQGLDEISKAAPKAAESMRTISEATSDVQSSFSALDVVMITVLAKMTTMAMSAGKKIANALWGPILSGGTNRALNIEAAKFQLEGLGVAWDEISDDINYGVQDTAYGLDAAAKVASQLVASNVQIGDEMKNTLRGISGVAAMTNSSYEEIGNIFTTVASNGKLMTMQLRQLSARGLNVSATLAKYYKEIKGFADTTEEEINDLVSHGKISFKEFSEAMDWAFGEHAKEANKTFTGSLSNIKAALSRIGAEFASPTFDRLKDVFNALIPLIKKVQKSMEPIVTVYKGISQFAASTVVKLFESQDFIEAILNGVINIYTWIRPVIAAFMEFTGMSSDVGKFAKNLNEFMVKFQLYGENAVKVKNIFLGVFNVISFIINAIKNTYRAVSPLISIIATMLSYILGGTSNLSVAISKIMPKINTIVYLIASIIKFGLEKVIGKLAVILSKINLSTIISGLRYIAIGLGAAIVAVINFGKMALNFFKNLSVYIPYITNAISNMLGVLRGGALSVGDFISNLFGGGSQTTTLEVNTSGMDSSSQIRNTVDALEDVTDKAPSTVKSLNNVGGSMKAVAKDADTMSKSTAKSTDSFVKNASRVGKVMADNAKEVRNASDNIRNNLSSAFNVSSGEGSKKEIKKNGMQVSDILPMQLADSNSPIDTFFAKIIDKLHANSGLLFSAAAGVVSLIKYAFNFIKTGAIKAFNGLKDVLDGVNVAKVILTSIVGGLVALVGWLGVSVVRIINGVIGWLEMGPQLSKALVKFAAGFKAQYMAEELKSVALIIASIGGLLVAITLISQYADVAKLKDVLSALTQASKTILQMIIFIKLVGSLGETMITIRSVMSWISTGKFTVKYSTLANLADNFKAIALMIASVAASLWIISTISESDLKRSLLVTLGILVSIFGFVTGLSFIAKKFNVTRVTSFTGSIFNPTFGRSVNSSLGGFANFLLALVPALIGISFAIKILGQIRPTELKRAGIALTQIMGELLIFIGILSLISREFSKGSIFKDVQNFKNSGINKDALNGISRMILTIAALVLSITLSVSVLSSLKPGELYKAIGAIEEIAAVLVGMIAALMVLTTVCERLSAFNLNPKSIAGPLDRISELLMKLSATLLIMTGIIFVLSMLDRQQIAIGLATIEEILMSIFAFMFALAAIAILINKTGSEASFNSVVASLVVFTGMLLLLGGAFTLIAFILQDIDFSFVSKMQPLLNSVMWFIGIMAAIIGIMAGFNLGGEALINSIAIIGGLSVLLLAIGFMFKIMSTIDWAAMNGCLPYLSAILIFVGAMSIITVVLAALGPGAAIAAAAMGAIAVLILSIGATFMLIASSIQIVTDSVNQLINIPWDKLNSVGEGLNQFLAIIISVAAQALQAFGAIMMLPMLAFALLLLVPAIWAISNIDLESITQAGVVLETFFIKLQEIVTKYGDLVEMLIYIAAIFPIAAIALAVGATALVIGVGALILVLLGLLVCGELLSLAGTSLEAGFTVFIEKLQTVKDLSNPLFVISTYLIEFSIELGIAGAFMIVAGALLGVGALLFLAAAGVLDQAMPYLMMVLDTISNDAWATQIAKFIENTTMLSVGAVAMFVAAVLLTLTGGLLWACSKVIKSAMTTFQQGMQAFYAASVSFVNGVQNIKQGLIEIVTGLFELPAAANQAGVDLVTGFVEGVEDSITSACSAVSNCWNAIVETARDVFEWHSPSQLFRSLGWDIIAGFCEGIEETAADGIEAIVDFGSQIVDNAGIDLSSAGGFSVDTLVDGIVNGLMSALPGLSDTFSRSGEVVGNNWTAGAMRGMSGGINALKSQLSAAQRQKDAMLAGHAPQEKIDAINAEISSLQDQIASFETANNFDFIDVSKWASSLGGGSSIGMGTSSDLASAIAGSSGAGSGINDTSKSYGVGNTINSNNTYNYIQNNYSPEPLTRSEIYDATQEQLRNWRGYELTLANSL